MGDKLVRFKKRTSEDMELDELLRSLSRTQREIDLAVAYYARGRKLVSYDGTYAYWDKVALDMICQQFGVSKTAAVIRLRQLGHLETRPYSEYNDPLEVWA